MRTGEIAFSYRPTPDDYRAAVRVWSLRTWPGLRALLMVLLLGQALIWWQAWMRHWDTPSSSVCAATVLAATVFVVIKVNRRKGDDQYAGLEEYGDCRTVADGEGLHTEGAEGLASTLEWTFLRWWFETPEGFAVTEGRGTFLVLPKRGAAAPDDVDRMRALLAGRLKKI
ncbi:YcxB family protein [Streptomyces sp. NPDC089799]|uniref:YcxB family protein n=1 Tax=Streptomyces sp. NPDC089799 TaxID=3155066 RepID=UPI00341C491C